MPTFWKVGTTIEVLYVKQLTTNGPRTIVNDNIRLSRIAYPRATWAAFILLATVFLTFGLIAQAHMGDATFATSQPVGDAFNVAQLLRECVSALRS